MSATMDYGRTRPEPAEAEHEPMTLPRKCLAWTVMVLIIWAAGALILRAVGPQPPEPAPGTVVWHSDPQPDPATPGCHPRR